MHKKIALTALTFLASITLAACSKSPDVTANATGTTIGDTLKIGVNLELTGAVAAYGNAENDGIKLAVEEINKAGGVDGKKLNSLRKIINLKTRKPLLQRLTWLFKVKLMQ